MNTKNKPQAEQPAEEARGVDADTIDIVRKHLRRVAVGGRPIGKTMAQQMLALLAATAAGTGQDKAVYCECFQPKPKDGYCQDCGLTRMEWPQASMGAQGLIALLREARGLVEQQWEESNTAADHGLLQRIDAALAASKEGERA